MSTGQYDILRKDGWVYLMPAGKDTDRLDMWGLLATARIVIDADGHTVKNGFGKAFPRDEAIRPEAKFLAWLEDQGFQLTTEVPAATGVVKARTAWTTEEVMDMWLADHLDPKMCEICGTTLTNAEGELIGHTEEECYK